MATRETYQRMFSVIGFPAAAVEDVQYVFDVTEGDAEQLEQEIRAVYDGPVAVYGKRRAGVGEDGEAYSAPAPGFIVIVPNDLDARTQQAISDVIAAHQPTPRFVLTAEEKMGALQLATYPAIDAQMLNAAARMLAAALLRAQRMEAQGEPQAG